MKELEAEKLLGGYATGTLSDVERRILFSEALKHQELFDALVDEEVLRELLSDFETRKTLIAALSQVQPLRPPWRRPAFLGLAATLMAAVGGSWIVWRSGAGESLGENKALPKIETQKPLSPELKQRMAPQPTEAPKAEPSPSKAESNQTAPPLEKAKSDSPKRADAEARDASLRTQETAPSFTAHGAVTAAPAPAAPAPIQAAPELKRLEKEENQPQKKATPLVNDQRRAKTMKPQLNQDLDQTQNAYLENRQSQVQASLPGAALKDTLVQPNWTWLPKQGDKHRLQVSWARGTHLVLLKRSGKAATPMKPQSNVELNAERMLSTFEFTLQPDDTLDIYQLPQPVEKPEALPAEGPVQGSRARIRRN
jgi:hypothetical protein